MGGAAEYKRLRRAEVTLANGQVLQVRGLKAADFLELGAVPLLGELITGKTDKTTKVLVEEMVSRPDGASIVKTIARVCAVNCVVGPVDFKPVEKHPRDCAEDEVSIDEMDLQDLVAIMDKVVSISHVPGKEGGQGDPLARFP